MCRVIKTVDKFLSEIELAMLLLLQRVLYKLVARKFKKYNAEYCGTCHVASTFLPHPRATTVAICSMNSLLSLKFTLSHTSIFIAANDF